MEVRTLHATHPRMIATLDTEALREHYLIPKFFAADEACLTYSHVERMVLGGAMPVSRPWCSASCRASARRRCSPGASSA